MRFILTILGISLLFTTCQTIETNNLRIATAANMQFAIRAITKAFTEETNIKCETIVSSSGKLTAQIKEGAPYDVFISADMKYPNQLHQDGFSIKSPKVYAKGKLVLWSMKKGIAPNISILKSQSINHIAVANPKTAPYGKAAMQTLDFYELTNQLEEKLVYGESISQTNQFINLQAADIGFTAKSVVVSPIMKGKGQWIEIPDCIYTSIEQGIILLNEPTEDAKLFYDFLFSEKGQHILKTYGYDVH